MFYHSGQRKKYKTTWVCFQVNTFVCHAITANMATISLLGHTGNNEMMRNMERKFGTTPLAPPRGTQEIFTWRGSVRQWRNCISFWLVCSRSILKGPLNTLATVFPVIYTSACEIPTLLYTSSLKKIPFWAEPPCIVHHREYPPPPQPPRWNFFVV